MSTQVLSTVEQLEVRVVCNVWDDFPEDVRQVLVSFMGYKSYIRCRQVCRHWANSIGKTVSECHVPIEMVTPDDASSASDLKIAEKAFPRARLTLVPKAHFSWCQFLELPLPANLLRDLKSVTRLAILDSTRYWSIQELATLTNLQSLRLQCTFRPCGLEGIALRLNALTELHLFTKTTNFVAVTWGSLHLDAIRYLRNLRHLELGRLDHCCFDDDCLEAISHLPCLSHLSLHTDWPSNRKDWPVTTNGIQHLAALTALTYLRAPLFCYPVPGSSAAEPPYNLDALTWHQAWHEVMLCMPQLRRLHIVVPAPSEDAITAVASCHDLATLTLQVHHTKNFAHCSSSSASASASSSTATSTSLSPPIPPTPQQLLSLLGNEASSFLLRAKLIIKTPSMDVNLSILHHHGVSLMCKDPFPLQISGSPFPGSTCSMGGPVYCHECANTPITPPRSAPGPPSASTTPTAQHPSTHSSIPPLAAFLSLTQMSSSPPNLPPPPPPADTRPPFSSPPPTPPRRSSARSPTRMPALHTQPPHPHRRFPSPPPGSSSPSRHRHFRSDTASRRHTHSSTLYSLDHPEVDDDDFLLAHLDLIARHMEPPRDQQQSGDRHRWHRESDRHRDRHGERYSDREAYRGEPFTGDGCRGDVYMGDGPWYRRTSRGGSQSGPSSPFSTTSPHITLFSLPSTSSSTPSTSSASTASASLPSTASSLPSTSSSLPAPNCSLPSTSFSLASTSSHPNTPSSLDSPSSLPSTSSHPPSTPPSRAAAPMPFFHPRHQSAAASRQQRERPGDQVSNSPFDGERDFLVHSQLVHLVDELGSNTSDEEAEREAMGERQWRRRAAEEEMIPRRGRAMARLLHRLGREGVQQAGAMVLDGSWGSGQQLLYVPEGLHYRVFQRAEGRVEGVEEGAHVGRY